MTLADGVVTPDERKMLRKIYPALSLGPDLVDADLADLGYLNVNLAALSDIGPANRKPGSAGQNATTASSTRSVDSDHTAPPPSFTLDPVRVAQIIKETEQVAKLLAQVFEAEADIATQAQGQVDTHPNPAAEAEADRANFPAPRAGYAAPLLGLDTAHSALTRQILTRASWRRSELQSVATDAGLMLSGALERINDACFDHLDCALVEGEDPIEVDLELRDEIL